MRNSLLCIFLLFLGLAKVIAQPTISNTQTLRVYRLAIYVTHNAYKSATFAQNTEKVKVFWQKTEDFLNELYMRDIGVRFEVLRDERLIIKVPAEEVFTHTHNASYVIGLSTETINNRIGSDSYDVGICISYTSSKGIRGLAHIRGVYQDQYKGAAVAFPTKEVIAHEIGHLFGGRHTFSGKKFDYASEKTEYDNGQSVMSTGSPRDFFSLSSIQLIREHLVAAVPVGGIPLGTQPPHIDKTKIKKQYLLPKDTYFQFAISATDPDSPSLTYMAQQRDVRLGEDSSIAQYIIPQRSHSPLIAFKREYSKQTGAEVSNSWISGQTTGVFTFWLGVSDALETPTVDHIVQYDLAETQVEVRDGIPFKITTSTAGKTYRGGQRIALTWAVDSELFRDTKVRIRLSEDHGQTFPYTLAEGVDNTGSYELVLPNLSIGKKNYGNTNLKVGAGVIKIEVMEGIAFAVTAENPQQGGGFTIEKDSSLPLAFVGVLPQDMIIEEGQPIVEQAHLSAVSSCNNPIVTPSVTEEKKEGKLVKRIYQWIATDDCGGRIAHTQVITINRKKEIPTPEPKPAPTPEPKPAPTPEPKPAPTPEPKPAPTPEPKPAPTPEPAPKPYTDLNLAIAETNAVRCPDPILAEQMEAYIKAIRKEGDTVGGVVSCVVKGVPVGWGEPVFDKLHAQLGKAMLSINAVKGFEYGSGFAGTTMRGSQHNDLFNPDGTTQTNHSGGIQGGISNGMDIYFRVAFKPVATLMQSQPALDSQGNIVEMQGKGRHDPCVVPRAVPIVEAMTAMVLLDFCLINETIKTF